jgi:predicted deacylase
MPKIMDTFPILDSLSQGVHHLALPAGVLADGSPVDVPVTVIVGAQSRPRVAVTAAVHGDEFEGVRAVLDLMREITPEQLQGSIVLVPIANPPAFNACTRVSPLDGVNLNRIFPGSARGSFSERLADALTQQVIRQCDALIDLHSGGTRYLFQPQAGFYRLPDQPELSQRSFEMAQAFGLELLWELPGRAGVNSYEAMRAGIPAIGLEIGGNGRCEPAHVEQAKRGTLNVLAQLKMLPALNAPPVRQRVWRGDFTLCPASGLFAPVVALNEKVVAGQLLYSILNARGEICYQRHAAHDGLISAMRVFAAIQAGEWDVSVLQAVV